MGLNTKSSFIPVLILGVFFFIFGFVTWLNGTLIIYLKIACELNNVEAYLVTFAFFISYVVMALPGSWILQKTGFKKGMSLGLLLMALGALLFIPAAHTRSYVTFLTGLFVIGTGLTILQTASNPYITIIGPIDSAARRISIMGICNKVAGILGIYIMGTLILSDADVITKEIANMAPLQKATRLDELASRVIFPYSCIAAVLAILALLIPFSPLPEIEQEKDAATGEPDTGSKKSVFQFPNLVFGVVALFFYVGAEVIAGDTIGPYGQSQGIALGQARFFSSFTIGAMLFGYIIGIICIPRFISQSKALKYSGWAGIAFTVAAIITKGYISVLFIALLGLANALVWPAIWPLAIHGLGRFAKTGSALLIMAIAGGAVMPLAYGQLVEIPAIGHQQAYWILLPCYLSIVYYSTSGHKKLSW